MFCRSMRQKNCRLDFAAFDIRTFHEDGWKDASESNLMPGVFLEVTAPVAFGHHGEIHAEQYPVMVHEPELAEFSGEGKAEGRQGENRRIRFRRRCCSGGSETEEGSVRSGIHDNASERPTVPERFGRAISHAAVLAHGAAY